MLEWQCGSSIIHGPKPNYIDSQISPKAENSWVTWYHCWDSTTSTDTQFCRYYYISMHMSIDHCVKTPGNEDKLA